MDQKFQALQLANQTRLGRFEVRKQVKRGELSVVDAAASPHLRNLPLFELLMWQNRWGRDRARRLLVRLGIGEGRTCGQLTDRQVGLVADELERRERMAA